MKAIIDSGSSKADWVFIDKNNSITSLETIGFNPLVTDSRQFIESFQNNPAKPKQEKVKQVFFYGAGCSTNESIQRTQNVLQLLFPAAKIMVENDLLGAARATYQGKPSVVAILGTGSNSCLFNGTKIIDQVANLGYLLGEEGSGYALGKEILRSFFYRELSPELTVAFQDTYQLNRNQLVHQIYSSSSPNRDIAAFSAFAVKNRTHSDIQTIVSGIFQDFVERNLQKYEITPSIPIHFVGSIAYLFRNKMEELLEERDMLPGVFLQKPIDGLSFYHMD